MNPLENKLRIGEVARRLATSAEYVRSLDPTLLPERTPLGRLYDADRVVALARLREQRKATR